MRKRRVRIVRRLYPHWGRYSGYHRFAAHLKPPFVPEIREVPIGDGLFPLTDPKIREWVLARAKRGGLQWYELNDLMEEIRAVAEEFFFAPDVIHYLDGDHSPQFIPRVSRRLGRKKVVASFHQTPEILEKILSRPALEAFEKVVAVSSTQVEFFRKHLPPSRVSLLLHGVDTEHFSPGPGRAPDGKFRLITVGSWLRDFQALFAVAASLADRPEFEFIVVAAPPKTPPVPPPNVRFVTGIDDDALRDAYRSSDALFLPLQNATANNALLEGMACGLPVLTRGLPSIREYASPDTILVAKNDPAKYAEAIVELSRRPHRRERMGRASRERALELSWPKVAAGFQALYEELCA